MESASKKQNLRAKGKKYANPGRKRRGKLLVAEIKGQKDIGDGFATDVEICFLKKLLVAKIFKIKFEAELRD